MLTHKHSHSWRRLSMDICQELEWSQRMLTTFEIGSIPVLGRKKLSLRQAVRNQNQIEDFARTAQEHWLEMHKWPTWAWTWHDSGRRQGRVSGEQRTFKRPSPTGRTNRDMCAATLGGSAQPRPAALTCPSLAICNYKPPSDRDNRNSHLGKHGYSRANSESQIEYLPFSSPVF